MKINPCPYCGNPNIQEVRHTSWVRRGCFTCGVLGPKFSTTQDDNPESLAFVAWNRAFPTREPGYEPEYEPEPRDAVKWFASEIEKVLRAVFPDGWREHPSWVAESNIEDWMTDKDISGQSLGYATIHFILADLARIQEKEASHEEE